MSDFLFAAAAELERRAAEADVAEARYGVQVGPNAYERHEGDVLISSLVVEGGRGSLVYELVGLSFADLV